MGNISKKASFLHDLLKQAGVLTKEASGQKITHKSLDASQPAIGNEMQKETQTGTEGNYASDKKVDAAINGVVEPAPAKLKVEGSDEASAASVLAQTGTSIEKKDPQGNPGDVLKSAAVTMKKIESAVQAHAKKEQEAAQAIQIQKQAAAKDAQDTEDIPTATALMNKIAAMVGVKSEEELLNLTKDIDNDYKQLAEKNPLFNVACENRMLAKMAAEIDALAAAEGISPEQAAQALDAATAADPEAAAELNSEIQGEALSDLAAAEEAQANMMDGLDQTAAQVSEMTGENITSDDIISAVEEVVNAADEMGVAPEVLIQAAAEQMMQGGEQPSEEDMAQAEQLVQEAAANGVSPEELLQGLTQELGGAGAAPAEQPAPEAAPKCEKCDECEECQDNEEQDDEEQDDDMDKTACLKKLASTRRGANLFKILTSAKG